MLRTVGLCVIVISGIGCGFAMSNELGRRKKMMEMILRMIILLRGEIRYGNKSLYDAFTGASGKLEGKYREFFILTAQKMKETEYAIRELRKDFCEKRKLYRSMGILGGIFVAVFFW